MSTSDIRVEPEAALDPLVLAIDVGSTASRGGLYDAAGRPVRGLRHKVPHQFTTATDGTSQIDPDQVVREVEAILTAVATDGLAGRIAGVAMDTFASSLVGVDGEGRALTPCFTYADSRCAPQVVALRQEMDERAVQQRTGTRLHTSYLPARLRWLRESTPETFAAVDRWLSLGEYIYLQLLGTTAVGTSTAAWTGLLDRRTGAWDAELLMACRVRPEQFSEIRDPDRPLDAGAAVGRRWPALAGTRWFPVITDGFASNVGGGAADESTIAAAAATSGAMRVLAHGIPDEIPPGLWCYRVDSSRSLLGGALNDVGRVLTWLGATVQMPDDADLGAALSAAPDAATPVVLPFLTGERSTGWAANARAVVTGVSVATTPTMLVRGAMEGVAIAYARVAGQLEQAAGRPQRIVASGRVTQDLPSWLQVLADAIGAPVHHVTMKRTTLRGTALVALEVLAPEVPRAPVETGGTYEPVPGRAEYYAGRKDRFEELYDAVIDR